MMFFLFALLLLTVGQTSQLAQPKGFTDDPYVDDEKFIEKVVKHEVVGVIGETVAVPCNCTPAYSHLADKPALILWYKDRSKLPIYSFDLRSSSGGGQHWKDEGVLAKRGYVYYEESPHSCRSSLNLDPVVAGDGGQYRCRVDYETSPTRNTRIKLKLVAKPTKPVISSEAGQEVVVRTDPLKVGSSLKLYCSSGGGDPTPSLTWRKEGVPVSPVGFAVDSVSGLVTSTLLLTELTPEDQGAAVSCTAVNSGLIAAQTTTVVLDIIVGPVRAKLVRESLYFLAEQSYNLTCQVLGSRPAAHTNIFLGGTQLPVIASKTSSDGNISTSVATFTPSQEDDGKFVSCQATNTLIEDSGVEDQWKISVHWNNASLVRPGQDITLKCLVQANPGYHDIVWTKGGTVLDETTAKNVHILDQTLFLSSVSKENSGDYVCTVTNQAGSGRSNVMEIRVPDSPSCLTNQTEVVVVGTEELAQVQCEVSWVPGYPLAFVWSRLSEQGERLEVLEEVGPVLTYPGSEGQAVVECRARDGGGHYGQPCTYQIIITEDSLAPVLDCSTYNQTFSSFTVSCSVRPGRPQDSQSYQFEVRSAHSPALLQNLSSSTPRLTVSDLPSASDFLVSVYSAMAGLRSKPFTLEGFTTRPGEKQLATMPELEATQHPLRIIPIAVGILLVSLLLVLIIIGAVAVVRRKISGARNSPSSQLELLNNQKLETGLELDYSPDLIPKDQGFGYCQTPDDLQYRNNMRATHQMYRTTSTTTTNTNINIPANLECSSLKRVKFVDQEIHRVHSASHQGAELAGGKVHLCPMHKHKLAISATNLYKCEKVPLVNKNIHQDSQAGAGTGEKEHLETFSDVEFKL